MQKALIFKIAKPYLTASAAMTATLLLIIGIYFSTGIESLWVALLWILLIAAILGMIAQTVHTEIKVRNYKAQLATSKERLTNEIKHRLWAEKTTSESKIRLQFIDENIPVMLAYFNLEQRCRYHNRIFRQWFGLKPDQIDGHLLQEFSNKAFLAGITSHIEDAINGKTIHNERILKSAKGFPYVFSEQFVPHMDNKGKVIGFYTLHTPRAQDKTRSSSNTNPDARYGISQTLEQGISPSSGTKKILSKKSDNQSSKEDMVATRIMQAIDGGEFQLYCQKIMPLTTAPNSQLLYEILIRRFEEENNLMPPGAFLPLVEQYKMMPRLDRWVVSYLANWLSKHPTVANTIFCINVAKDTVSDTDFPDFIRAQIQKTKIPATSLCFEIEEMDAELNPAQAISLAGKIKQLGCLVSLCGFSHNPSLLGLQEKMKIDFLKIDGSLICNMLQEEEDLKKVKAIYQIGRTIKAKTIAELVEDNEIIAKLREIGIDFAQGFGIAKPHPLKDVE